jgi:hypothetical protein
MPRGQPDETLLSPPGWRETMGRVSDPTEQHSGTSTDSPADSPAGDEPAGAAPTGPFTFRLSQLSLFAVLTFTICLTPLAISAWWLLELYLIPIGLVWWIRRNGTTIADDGITTRGMVRTRRVAWSEVTALRLRTRSRIGAVLDNGAELPLPAVHVRDLPLLAAASGGRIPDPTTPAAGSSPAPDPAPAPPGEPAREE